MERAWDETVRARDPPPWSYVMKNLAMGLLGAAALATTILLVRQQKELEQRRDTRLVQAGSASGNSFSLERIREAGL